MCQFRHAIRVYSLSITKLLYVILKNIFISFPQDTLRGEVTLIAVHVSVSHDFIPVIFFTP